MGRLRAGGVRDVGWGPRQGTGLGGGLLVLARPHRRPHKRPPSSTIAPGDGLLLCPQPCLNSLSVHSTHDPVRECGGVLRNYLPPALI